MGDSCWPRLIIHRSKRAQLCVRISRYDRDRLPDLMRFTLQTALEEKAFRARFCVLGFFINFNWPRYSRTRAHVPFSPSPSSPPFSLSSPLFSLIFIGFLFSMQDTCRHFEDAGLRGYQLRSAAAAFKRYVCECTLI